MIELRNVSKHYGRTTALNGVSVRIGDYTYCAVGEISHEHLTELLSHILGDGQE